MKKNFNDEEKEFQQCWEAYWHCETTKAGQKRAWDKMWVLVRNACDACCKTKAYGLRIQDLEGKALDACIKIMENIKNGVRPERLSSYVYLYCLGQLYNKKHIEWERSQSFEDTFDNYIYVKDDDNIFLCKQDY